MLEAAVFCLAMNIAHEAPKEALPGQIMVSITVMNRADWEAKNVCNVIFKPKQYSWTLFPHTWGEFTKSEWIEAQRVARLVINKPRNEMVMMLGNEWSAADHYHADYVHPLWADDLTYIGKLGHHLFYRK